MAPNKKGGKKKDDDWEADLGESIDAGAGSTPAENEAGPEEAVAGGGGGLMAAIKKNKTKKQKKGGQADANEDQKPSAAVPDADDTTEPNGGVDYAAKAPQEASLDDAEFAPQSKKGKPLAQRPKPQDAADSGKDADDSGDGDGRIKSKKEKEKEKREREKQRKKEQAAKKKTTPAPAPAPKEEVAKPVPETKAEVKAEAAPSAAAAAAADAGKKKKVPAALAALQKQQELLRKQQEERARFEAEEKARIEEEERAEAEAEKKREEVRALKKAKEKEKKEQLKKEGKLLTKAQKEAKERNELRMKQMLAAGGKVAGLEEGAEKKKPVYDKRKKPKKRPEDAKKDEQLVAEAAQPSTPQAEEVPTPAEEEPSAELDAEQPKVEKEEDEDVDEDWEAAADKDDDVKENWDEDSDEEADEQKQPSKKQSSKSQKNADGGGDERAEMAAANGAKPEGARGTARPTTKPPRKPEQSSDEDDDEHEVISAEQRAAAQRKEEAAERRRKQHEEALAARSKDNLRSPICCILGHVDTGKTKLLDKIRQTNVQEGEAGGITQQIGATYFPVDAIKQKTQVVNKSGEFDFKVPGLLVIDTPGHESFTNLRSRGSSLCNIAILVVDIMHGLEPQTLESMRLLRDRKTPFIVALNKIDRLYGWKPIANNGFQESLAMQNKGVLNEFRDRLEKTKVAFAEQAFNSELYYENKSMARNVSLVPTSAHTGEGIPDMLKLLVQLTQERMANKLMYLSEVECTVLEVKVIEGFGTTIDVILSNGVLREGERIVLCGLNGAICTNIRALLTPAPLKELRVKSQYIHNKEVKASLGVKIAAHDLEHAIAGSRLLVVGPDDDEEDLEVEVMSDLENLLSKVSTTGRGVSVQASTLGSLEALLEFLRVSKIPVANISIGPVYKRDVMQAGIMLEKSPEYAVMLCFDVKVDKDAQAYADEIGVKIFTADIIYHLFDDFTKHMAQLAEQKKEDSKLLAVFPCVLAPVQVFNKKDPIVIGVDVVEGNLRLLTPVAAVKTNPTTGAKEIISLGRVSSIEREHKQIPICKKGQPSVAVKIEGPNQPLYGRQLEEKDILYSLISRESIDTLKEYFRQDVSMDEWALIKKLKTVFDIP
ncbi:MAG: hypothetical protein M1823_001525 [Watsoniomyces obsoletus]|nr:MAG: hypothetical protein M1823_001525 [Watsoniomyces obsoletus]